MFLFKTFTKVSFTQQHIYSCILYPSIFFINFSKLLIFAVLISLFVCRYARWNIKLNFQKKIYFETNKINEFVKSSEDKMIHSLKKQQQNNIIINKWHILLLFQFLKHCKESIYNSRYYSELIFRQLYQNGRSLTPIEIPIKET